LRGLFGKSNNFPRKGSKRLIPYKAGIASTIYGRLSSVEDQFTANLLLWYGGDNGLRDAIFSKKKFSYFEVQRWEEEEVIMLGGATSLKDGIETYASPTRPDGRQPDLKRFQGRGV